MELDGFPYDLLGFIDIEEPGRIRDTKTASKSPNKNAADVSQQLTVYAAGHLAVEGELPDELVLDYLVDTKSPKPVSLPTTRTKEDVQMLLRRVERAATIIERGAFTPAPADAWQCSKKWCGYFDQCPFSTAPRAVSMATKNSNQGA